MSDAFIAHLHDLFAPLGALAVRRMFGGHGLYLDGVFFAIVIDEALYLKADAGSAPRFEAAGSAPFVYHGQGKPIAMSYWSVPEEAMDAPQAMAPWARLAMDAALRKPKAPPRTRKPRDGKPTIAKASAAKPKALARAKSPGSKATPPKPAR